VCAIFSAHTRIFPDAIRVRAAKTCGANPTSLVPIVPMGSASLQRRVLKQDSQNGNCIDKAKKHMLTFKESPIFTK